MFRNRRVPIAPASNQAEGENIAALVGLLWADIVQRADIGVIQRRDGLSLALKPLGKILGGNLDRHDAIEPRVLRLADLAYSGRTDGRRGFHTDRVCDLQGKA